VRSIICDHKIDGSEWLNTARLAHKHGFRSNATMLYGHIENDEDRVDICSSSAKCKTKPAASRPSSHWPSIPNIPRSIICL